MRVGHLELPVHDPLASLAFYTEVLGFSLVANQADRFVWVALGETLLLLRPGPPAPVGKAGPHPNLVLYAEDVEAEAARLASQGLRLELRGTCRYFQDPDGHWFQLVDPGADHSGS